MKVKVALLQHGCGTDVAANHAKVLAMAERAAASGAKVICTQELYRSQYFCQSEDYEYFKLAESIPGPSTEAWSEFAKRHGVVVVSSLFEKRTHGLYHNTAVVIDADGTLLGSYRKMHIPDDPLFYEKFYFTPGDLGYRVFNSKYGRIGVLVCWDQWYPEAARLTALKGAEILVYPTAIGWHPKEPRELQLRQHGAWETIQRSHAVANGCYVLSINRSGFENPAGGNGLQFWGQSFITGTMGELLAKAPVEGDEILTAELDLAQIDDTRTHWPFYRDRRTDSFGDLTARYLG
jgi:N-carbamoylputrescine amidase